MYNTTQIPKIGVHGFEHRDRVRMETDRLEVLVITVRSILWRISDQKHVHRYGSASEIRADHE